jgi:hypothetical protein
MKNPIQIGLVIISYVTSIWAVAAPSSLVVGTSRTRAVHLKAYQNTHAGAQTLARHLLENNISEPQRQSLRSRFAEAQSLFFNASAEEAIAGFQSVLDLRLSASWQGEDQLALLYSALRIFELSEDKRKKQTAMQLARILGSPKDIDRSVFSPLTLHEFTKAQAATQALAIPVTGWMKSFEFLLVEGKVIDLVGKTRIQLAQTHHQSLISFYSSTVQPLQIVSTPSRLIELQHSPVPLVNADCVETTLDLPKKLVVLDQTHHCGSNKTAQRPRAPVLQTKNNRPIDSNHNATQKQISLSELKPKPLEKASTNLLGSSTHTTVKSSPKWYKNKWLWIGLGALATSAVIYDQQSRSGSGKKKPRDAQPSSTFER